MNKADKVKQKLIKEVVIPSLIGVLIALLFLLAVVKPTGASEDSTRPMTGTVYFVSGRSVSIVSPDKRTWSYKGKGFSVGDTVSCVVSNNGTSKTVDDYIKSAVVSEGQPIEIEAAEEDAGLVSVFLLDEVLKYNPEFDYHLNYKWMVTWIKDFKGTVEFVVKHIEGYYEEDTDYWKKGDYWEDYVLEVVGHGINKVTGKPINFVGKQTGL